MARTKSKSMKITCPDAPTTCMDREQRVQYEKKNGLSVHNERNSARTTDSKHYKERTSNKNNNYKKKIKVFYL